MEIKLPKIKHLKQKTKLIIILSLEFIAIIGIIALIFLAGKQTHTVTFDLNGGILISGDTEQRVTQGQNAIPPNVAKFGHYLMGWSGSYKSVTGDVTVKAIWEYETSPGIEYSVPENTNYCLISGSFKEIQGEVYIGSYYSGRQVLGIKDRAFSGREGITAVYLLDGILSIGEEAFRDCTKLEVIDIPSTVVRIEKGAFAGCTSLKEVILPDSLVEIEEGAFSGCTSLEKVTFKEKTKLIGKDAFSGCVSLSTVEFAEGLAEIGEGAFAGCENLVEIVLPASVKKIGANAFNTPKMLINLYISKENMPDGFTPGWCDGSTVFEYDYQPPEIEDEEADGESDGFWGDIL